MKRFLTIILFFAMFITFGQQIENYKQQTNLAQYLLKIDNKDFNLAYGVDLSKIVDMKKLSDFTTPFTTDKDFKIESPNISSENNIYVGFNTDKFYDLDFAEDPFDGLIQVYVMGEPLPSPTVTLICALGVIGILLYCKKKKEVIA